MAKLSFLDQLDERQLEYANKIATKAKEMGIPPSLAISIAYHESRLNPNVQRGTKGEFGIMQVMPSTGKGMGYTNKDLGDPDKNIEAGLKYLKQNLDAFGGDLQLATVGYNAGTDSSFFSGGELPKITEAYVKAMKGYGAYDAEPAGNNGDMTLGPRTAAPPPTRDVSGASAGERFLGGGMGAVAGTLATGIKGVADTRMSMAAQRAGAEETARIAAQRAAAAAPVSPSAPPAAGSPPVSDAAARQPIPSGGPDGGRMPAGQTGNAVYNYGKAYNLTDIEAAKALDTTKQTGGVHDLATQRREGLNRVQQLGGGYTENPRYGGIMTPDQNYNPPKSYTYKAPVAPNPDLPQGQAGGLSQLPTRQAISTALEAPPPPPPPSFASKTVSKASAGLDYVGDLFKSMMRPMGQATATVGRYALPPLAGLSAGLDAAEIAHEYDKPADQRDYTKMGLKTAGIIGGGLSMIPATARFGVPLAIGASAYDYYRDNPELVKQKLLEARAYANQKMQNLTNTPLLDEMTDTSYSGMPLQLKFPTD